MSVETARPTTAKNNPFRAGVALSADTLVKRASDISEQIAAAAEEGERARKVPDRIIDAIDNTGILEMLVPKRFGGHELRVGDLPKVIKALTPLDTSVGWTTSFYIGHNWMWSLLPEEAQMEIFAAGPSARGPVMVAPTVKATPAKGGFHLNGRAKWGTGSAHADWCMVGGIVDTGVAGPPDVRMFAMPRQDVRLEDTWHTSGMAATASNDVIFDNIFVPSHRVMNMDEVRKGDSPGARLHNNSLYNTPFTPFLCFIAAVPLVAVTRGVAKLTIERAKEFVSSYTGKSSIDNPALQIRLAKADLAARAAETLLDELALELEHHARNAPADVNDRVLMRAKASYIANLCRDTVTLLSQGSGASGHMLNSPIQRAFRDINMAACHVVFDQDPTMELYGKILVGRPPEVILA